MNNGVAAAQAPLSAQTGTYAVAVQPQATLPGVVIRTAAVNPAPMILVQAFEKAGKSSTVITTLADYPAAGKHALVLAFDRSGPDACIRLGYHPHVISIRDYPATDGTKSLASRARSCMQMLTQNKAKLHETYGAIVVDCASTMASWFLDEARMTSKNPDPRSHFNEMMTNGVEFINRVIELGLPNVWLAWLSEAEISEERDGQKKTKKIVQGGVELPGKKFRKFIAGRADHIMILERQPSMPGAPGASSDGFMRVFHTQPWDNINAGGRYSHLLPEPAPAHMGYILYSVASGKPLAELLQVAR